MTSWSVYWLRFFIGLVGTALVAWGISFEVADYVTEKSRDGFTTSIGTLQASVSDLNANVTAVSQNVAALNQTISSVNTNLSSQLLDLERERARLAVEIAREVQKLQGDQNMQGKDIDYLRTSIDRIEKSLIEINTNTKVRYTVDGGKTYESLDAEDALLKFGVPADGGSYVIAPWSYNRYDPNTGQIEKPQQ